MGRVMIGIAANSGGPGFDFHAGVSVTRLRRPLVPDQYDPDGPGKLGPWSEATEVTLSYAFIASATSSENRTEDRVSVTTSKALFLTDQTADVRHGDRVRDHDGITYEVDARPAADTNPWTGWRPIVEIPLTLKEG